MSGLKVHQFDLHSSLNYSRFEISLENLLASYDTADGVFENVGRQALMTAIADASLETHDVLPDIRTELEREGAVILNGTGVDRLENEFIQLTAIAISCLFGNPTATDQKDKRIAWPIQYDPDTTLERTYSQSLGEAAFHTDTQYFARPERFFGMYCVVADEPGKGTSELIDGHELVEEYRETYGDDDLAVLGRNYPFKVPSVFTTNARDEDLEVTWAPIFNSDTRMIRYRLDTITNALRLTGSQIDAKQQVALERVEDLIHEFVPTRHHLTPGDAVLIDNHRVLHARTAFDNPARLLYRVRMGTDE